MAAQHMDIPSWSAGFADPTIASLILGTCLVPGTATALPRCMNSTQVPLATQVVLVVLFQLIIFVLVLRVAVVRNPFYS